MKADGSLATNSLARWIAPCMPSSSGVRITSAPSARMIKTFSSENFSGTNIRTLYPRLTPMSANPIPVFPAVASTMVPPGALDQAYGRAVFHAAAGIQIFQFDENVGRSRWHKLLQLQHRGIAYQFGDVITDAQARVGGRRGHPTG